VRRREFITLVSGAAAWPLAVRAQEPAMPVVGFLGSLSQSAQSSWTAAFVQRMREHGWIEGRTVAIEYRWAEGRGERFAEIAAEFVRLKVNVIVTAGTDAVIAVKKATSIIPIVFGTAGDPVANGLVANLARPGGNVTGLSNQSADIAGKRIELLRTVVPSLRRLAIMANIASSIGALEMREVQAAAHTLGLEVITLEIRRAEDIAPAIERLKRRRRCTLRCDRAAREYQPGSNQQLGAGRATTDAAWSEALRRSGRPNVLWSEYPGLVQARRRLCRQDFTRHQAGRHPSRAADQIRSGHQHENC
jgi:ABC-type uncharacterized transport system substrate-binding protein